MILIQTLQQITVKLAGKMNSKIEMLAVKKLCDEIGHGNVMHLASILWQESLEEKDYPISGAFVPALVMDLKEPINQCYKEYKNVRQWLKKY
jgi:hypothetical protein